MKMAIVETNGINRKDIPTEKETIDDDLEIDIMLSHIKEMIVYFRPAEKCPFNRGNWVIDIIMLNNQLFCIKLPKEMTEAELMRYLKPLTDKLDTRKRKGKH